MSTVDKSERDCLLDEIREEVRDTHRFTGRSELEQRVMEALRQTPRDEFVPHELRYGAYANRPLPIGHGQTISQPYVVALMTDLIQPRADDVVLEIGAGSGYQAAVLSHLVKQVYSIEIIEELAGQASQRLQRLGYENVEVRAGNGRLGWPEHAPYDAILVTAATTRVPPALIEQLKPGGTMVIPVGAQQVAQDLVVIRKLSDGSIEEKHVLPVVFVPLTGSPHD
ncbi:MAG: protein-L-isoaspartate(D-aspartate) O-methyltransferase [Sulfuritalea sp.]|nr:protein-L-isoaspartate(D-aspartate) O-methyltransferase [Sulfuritalea sp.]